MKNQETAETSKTEIEKLEARYTKLRLSLYHTFCQERMELLSRIYRLENRIKALGFDVPKI